MLYNPVFGGRLRQYPEGHIYQGFGENYSLYHQSVCVTNCNLDDCCLAGHNGIDIAMAEGTSILASAGTVVEVKNDSGGYGKHVKIITMPDNEGKIFECTYGHLRDIFVLVGQEVPDGYSIGTMGNTGFVVSEAVSYWGNAPAGKGVHLHFGVRELSKTNTGWLSSYPEYYMKNYENGFLGAIDPLLLIDSGQNTLSLLMAIQAALVHISTKIKSLLGVQ